MRTKVIVWVVPALFGVALLRSLFAAEPEPVQVAQVPGLFDEPAEVGREPVASPDGSGEVDPDEFQPRSRLVRSMYDLLDGMQEESVEGQGISDEQRRFIRRELMMVDDELADSMGSNLRRAILRANHPRNTFSVGAPSSTQPMQRIEVEELHRINPEEPGEEITPDAPVEPADPAAEPASEPAADLFDN